MTTRPPVTRIQLEVLEAADAGVLVQSQRRGESYMHWRIEIDEDITKPVTRTADRLIARQLIAKGEPRTDGAIPAVLTDAGRELLVDLHGIGPADDKSGA